MDKLKPTDRKKANVEAEKGETVVTKFFEDLFPEHYEISGKKHKDGGTPLDLPSGSFIYSDAPNMKIKDKKVLDYLGETKSKTIAEIAKKYDLNKFKKILTDKNVSPIDRNSALVGMANNLEKLGFLALYQEMMKGLPDGVPEIANEFLNKNPEYVDKIKAMVQNKEENQQPENEQKTPMAYLGMNIDPTKEQEETEENTISKLEPKTTLLSQPDIEQKELKESNFNLGDYSKAVGTINILDQENKSKDMMNMIRDMQTHGMNSKYVTPESGSETESESKNKSFWGKLKDRFKKDDPLKGYTKEEIEKMIKEGKIKADVKKYNLSLVVPGGYQSMMMDKMMANYANWLEGNLQSAYMTPVYNANRVFGSHAALDKGDYVQSGTQTGDFRINKYRTNTGYDTFTLPYYPGSHPQMKEGGQMENRFDPGLALKSIFETLNTPVYSMFEEGGPVKELKDTDIGKLNKVVKDAYNELLSNIDKDVELVYNKIYSNKNHTPEEKQNTKENIKKIIVSSYNAAAQGLYDLKSIGFEKQDSKSTSNIENLNQQLGKLLEDDSKTDVLKDKVKNALKLNTVNNLSNFNPDIFTEKEINNALTQGNVKLNKDNQAKLRKEYYDAWGLSGYSDPKNIKDDLSVALFQQSFYGNAEKGKDDIVLSDKSNQKEGNIKFKRSSEYGKTKKSENISSIDGYLGDRTINQMMLDLSVFKIKPEQKQEPLKQETRPPVLKPETKEENKEKPVTETKPPKQKARGYYFLQDKNKIALALNNLYSIRKRPPYEPEPVVSLPDYALLDPNRSIQAMQQSYKTGMEMQAQYAPPQIAAANIAAMSGDMATNVANLIGNVQNQNVGIANMASANTTQLINDYLRRKGSQMQSLHDKYTIMEERYTADRNKALANLTSEINNALTNAAKAQTINEMLYKDSPYYIEPETGGTTHFDPKYAHSINLIKPEDREKRFNEVIGILRSQGIKTDSLKPEDLEKWSEILGKKTASGSETVKPSGEQYEKEQFRPWWELFPGTNK